MKRQRTRALLAEDARKQSVRRVQGAWTESGALH
jgi:hypothetical protein